MDKIKKDCIIIGAGTYGQVYAKYLSEDYTIRGFVDDDPSSHDQFINDIRVLGSVSFLSDYMEKFPDTALFVPIGNNNARVKILKDFEGRGYDIPSFIHRDTIIHESVVIGKAVYVLPGSNIMPFTELKDFVMVSMGVNIAHHVTVEEGCFFSQGSNIGASVTIKEKAYFGIASTVMTGISNVGAHAMLGAGAVAIKDIEDNAVMVGNPAKFLRKNN